MFIVEWICPDGIIPDSGLSDWNANPLSHEETSTSEGNLNAYVSHLFLFTYIRLTDTES